MEYISMKCPHCGASTIIEEDKLLVKCPYCGDANLIVEDKDVVLKRLGIKEKELEIEKEKQDLISKNAEFIRWVKAAPLLLLLLIALILISKFEYFIFGL